MNYYDPRERRRAHQPGRHLQRQPAHDGGRRRDHGAAHAGRVRAPRRARRPAARRRAARCCATTRRRGPDHRHRLALLAALHRRRSPTIAPTRPEDRRGAARASFLGLLNEGILLTQRGLGACSLAMTDDDVDRFVERAGPRARRRAAAEGEATDRWQGRKSIDLNCDMGESYGRWTLGADEEIMPFITLGQRGVRLPRRRSARHAQDGGAGARRNVVAIGSHPSLPDLMGFGRRVMDVASAS